MNGHKALRKRPDQLSWADRVSDLPSVLSGSLSPRGAWVVGRGYLEQGCSAVPGAAHPTGTVQKKRTCKMTLA